MSLFGSKNWARIKFRKNSKLIFQQLIFLTFQLGIALLSKLSEGIFSNNQPCQHFMERTGFLAHQRYRRLTTSYFISFLMENSILKIFVSLDVKITPDFLINYYTYFVFKMKAISERRFFCFGIK